MMKRLSLKAHEKSLFIIMRICLVCVLLNKYLNIYKVRDKYTNHLAYKSATGHSCIICRKTSASRLVHDLLIVSTEMQIFTLENYTKNQQLQTKLYVDIFFHKINNEVKRPCQFALV